MNAEILLRLILQNQRDLAEALTKMAYGDNPGIAAARGRAIKDRVDAAIGPEPRRQAARPQQRQRRQVKQERDFDDDAPSNGSGEKRNDDVPF